MSVPPFQDLFDATLTLEGAYMPSEKTDAYFPLASGQADRHQLQMQQAITDERVDVIGNVNPTGSGKTLSWVAPTLRSGEEGDGWIVLATYPTRALVENQLSVIRDLYEQYYSATWEPRRRGHTITTDDERRLIVTENHEFRLDELVQRVTGEETIDRSVDSVLMEAYETAQKASQAGVPSIVLTTPDMLTLLATNRVRSPDVTQVPGLVDMIVVDEFHLANPRGKRLLPFHLDLYMRLTKQRYLDTLVFLSATPDATAVKHLERAFTTEIIGPTAHATPSDCPTPTTRQILPQAQVHLTSRQMFSTGQWLAEHADRILRWHSDGDQTVLILDSVREVDILATALDERSADSICIGRISGWHGGDRQATIETADIVVGNTALEVGVDFDRVSRLLCTAYDASSAIQRIGRMRARDVLDEYEIALVTTSETHSAILSQATTIQRPAVKQIQPPNLILSRDQLQEVLSETIDATTEARYYDALCAAYARYLWEDADDPLQAVVTPQEDLYKELVNDHFGPDVRDLFELPKGADRLWRELGEMLHRYEARYDDEGALALFEEMHQYRPSSLSALVIDTTEAEQQLKEYHLGHLLRYAEGQIVSQERPLTSIVESALGRPPTADEQSRLETIDRRTVARVVLWGFRDSSRQYTIRDFKQTKVWHETATNRSAVACFPRRLVHGDIAITSGALIGTEHIDITGEVLAQYSPAPVDKTRTQYHLGPYGNVLPISKTESVVLWQDATLVHAHLMSESITDSQ